MIKTFFITGVIIILIIFLLIPGSGLILLGLAAAGASMKNRAPHKKLRGILKMPKKAVNDNQLLEFNPRLIRIDYRLAALETTQMER